MDHLRWSEKAISFRHLVDNPSIPKPALVQIGGKAIIVGEKINGEFIMASPCKVSGDRFDVMEQEIVLSSKHTGIWRVISKATPKKEGHIHRLTTKDLERIHRQDVRNERATPRSYICIRDIEAFELIMLNSDPSIVNGRLIERRIKPIEEDTEFEITDTGEVEYTPSEGERTSYDYAMVPKSKQATLLQLLLPGVVEHEQLVRNRVLRVLHCVTKSESRKRHFLLEVNELPCEIRPIASEGSTELRYLHSTQNLYDYMLTYGNDTILYVKLLRGDPPIKAVEFDGYMVLKNTLHGDKIPICRVEDLEITLVSADLPTKVRLPNKSEQQWRSLSDIRAAEVQCMQLSYALLAHHESEMYVTNKDEKNTSNYLQSNSHQDRRSHRSLTSTESLKKYYDESGQQNQKHQPNSDNDNVYLYNSTEKQMRNVSLNVPSAHRSKGESTKRSTKPVRHASSDRFYRTSDDSYNSNNSQRLTASSNNHKTKTYYT